MIWPAAAPALVDFTLLLLRLTIGVMFALSGFFKLAKPERGQKMARSLTDAGLPTGLAPVIALGELLGGVGVVLGLFTLPAALVLFVISVGAMVTTTIPNAKGSGIHKLENLLYAPEAILAAALLALAALGAGGWSLDRALF